MTAEVLIRYIDAESVGPRGLCHDRTRRWFETIGKPYGLSFERFVEVGYTREQLRAPGRNLRHIETMYHAALKRRKEESHGR